MCILGHVLLAFLFLFRILLHFLLLVLFHLILIVIVLVDGLDWGHLGRFIVQVVQLVKVQVVLVVEVLVTSG